MNLLRPRSLRRPARSEDDGKLAGWHLEHWDDHVDAHVIGRKPRVAIGDGVQTPGLYFPGIGTAVVRRGRGRRARRVRDLHLDQRGAFTLSGLYVANFIDILDATQLAIDTSLATHKWAMYTNTLSPNFSTDAAYSATNEVTGTGYTAGGQVIVSPTTTESPTGTLMYDMADQVWASPTTVTARGAILYADVLATNSLIVAMTFTTDFTSTAGTFTIQFASTGVFTIDLTP